MRFRRWVSRPTRTILQSTSALLWLACGGDGPVAPATGAVEVTTSTTGQVQDPDGYTLLLDGAEVQTIGPAASATLEPVLPGTHLLGLTGISANCAVQGENPRGLAVAAGETTISTFAVACSDPPPTAGSLHVTTATSGPSPDPDGYRVTVDGGAGQPAAVNGQVSISNLPPGDHLVSLEEVADNCAVGGDNPRTASVSSGGTASVTFAITCQAIVGGLRVVITGLPDGTDAAVAVTGPGGYDSSLTATATVGDLAPGDYTVTAEPVASGGDRYGPSPPSQPVTVSARDTAEAAVSYALLPSLNLRVGGLYLTQSAQTPDNTVPLVAGRDAFLRVFVLANEINSAAPSVRLRIYQSGTLLDTYTIPSPGGSTPTAVNEGSLADSWNLTLPGSEIRPGLEIQVEVDPAGEIPEADETDNSFPDTGGRRTIETWNVPPLALTLVPVRQSANGLEGDVSPANRDEYVDLSRRLHPIPGYDAAVHSVFTTSGPLQSNDANGAWATLLGEIDALRVAEGTGRLYYGVVRLDYSGGQIARSLTGTPAAVGFDNVAERSRIVAHGLGHMWGRDHAPCGSPQALDPNYPYAGGQIGVYGYDVGAGLLKAPTTPDVMGLCQNVWISDYTYRNVMDFRGTAPSVAGMTGAAEPSLLVWGRIAPDGAVLEPAFHVLTRPSLPVRRGPYAVEGLTSDGRRAFAVSFAPIPLADGPDGARHFAFAVPLDQASAGRLARLRLIGPGVAMTVAGRARAALRTARWSGPAHSTPTLSRGSGRLSLRWDASAHPMALVRDPGSGQVLAFARGGAVQLEDERDEVELVLSDGVRSRATRVRLIGR